MAEFRQKTAAKSAIRVLKDPITDINTFEAIVRNVIMANPFGCISYMKGRKNHTPVENVREIYTAKFVYESANGKRVGNGSESYNTIAGYKAGIAAVISNMANIAAHGGMARHIPASDLYSAMLRCHDPVGEFYFVSITRDRITISSYSDDAIRHRVEAWADSVAAFG